MCVEDRNSPAGANYLVMLRNFIIMQDVADTIREYDPDASVLSVTGPDEALKALERVEYLAVAFIEAAPDAFRGSPLAARIAGCGGRVVFVGDAAEDAVGLGDTRVLNRPFSSGAVLDHLASSRRAAWEP